MARMSAAARREDVVGIAFRHFAEGGFDGTSTEDIAREAGISQPYLFRLFRTKKELFLACSDRCYEQISAVFSDSLTDCRTSSAARSAASRALESSMALASALRRGII